MAELYVLKNTTHRQMMGFVIKDGESIVVIDGGTPGDTEQMLSLLSSLSSVKPHVNGWFLTHPHSDHVSVVCDIVKNHPEVVIDGIYSHFPSSEFIEKYDGRDINAILGFEALSGEIFNTVERGDFYSFGGISVRVLQVFDPSVTDNANNNSSAVYMLTVAEKRILFMGDLGIEGGHRLISAYSREELSADFTQMTHHGQNGMDKECYEYIQPKACLWPTPDWLWDNDPGTGFNTGIWATVKTRQWMDELGVTEHYVEKDGIIRINL